ncbi:hypothetical protein NDU88_004528 [Pleurodeles waltl]|uniref:Uncharacterized protein n=1 Tax=Pleurodeles waltl TaxID=8319 RepID=A0AAV7SJ06_PLEWA|nr:hypothetical protein NDU88_004528 [Pleurodeles waltl]
MGVHLGQGLRHSSSSPLPRSSARAPRAGAGVASAPPSPGAQSAGGLPRGAKAQQGTGAWIPGSAANARRRVVLPSGVSDGAAFQCATLCAAYALGPHRLLPVSKSSGSRCPVRRDTGPQSIPGLFGPGAMHPRPHRLLARHLRVQSQWSWTDPASRNRPVVWSRDDPGAVSSRARSGLLAGAAPDVHRHPRAPDFELSVSDGTKGPLESRLGPQQDHMR